MVKFSIVIALAPDRSAEVLGSFKKVNYSKNEYEIIVEKGLNPSENRNNGIKKSKGEIIGFIDDDAIVDKNILKNVEMFFDKYPEMDIVGGPQLTPKTDGFFAKISGYALESYFGTHKMYKRYTKSKLNLDADEFSLSSANCFVKREIFNKIKGFNTKLFPGEDPEFFARAKKNGLKIASSPEIFIYHRRRADLFGFVKQFYKYGKVRLAKEKANKTIVNPLFLFPVFFVIYLITLPLAYLLNIYLIPLILYFIIGFLNSIYISIKYRDIFALFLVPFIYLILHISYGAGMIRGILNG